MDREEKASLVERFYEQVWSRGEVDAVDEFVDADFINFGVRCGTASMRMIVGLWRAAFPDLNYTVEDTVVEDEKVVARVTVTGTHTGEFRPPAMGIFAPTGKSFSVDQTHVFRLAGGRIIEHWATRNDLALLQQLGVILSPESAQTP
jgi:predicted ester cyclase